MDAMMNLLKKKHTSKEDGEESDKSEAPKRSRRAASSESPVGARGRSRSADERAVRRAADKAAKLAKASGNTD